MTVTAWWRKRRLAAGLSVVALAAGLAVLLRYYGPYLPIYLANRSVRAGLPPLDAAGLGDRLLVVAPHPDD